MIWVKCIFGLLIFEAIACSPAISDEKHLRVQRQIGGPTDEDPNDPKYARLAQAALRQYDPSNQYTLLQVIRATEQIVAGTLTEIDFYAMSTSSPSCSCQNVNPYNLITCHAKVVERPWLYDSGDITVNCN